MSTLKKISLVVTLLVSVVGCAGTIKLPLKDQPGIAIPLKAEDRLVLYNAKKYCAEPSPDAFRSYAKSLGLGAKFGENAAGSLSSAELSNAASIGLRTQSITLMRDILYRMCEAFNNGALGEVMAATLLGRSQDLVAVVLAIEQLTGTVAANQVVLTGTAGADAGTGLDDYKQLLNSAKQIEKARKQEMEDAKEKRDDRKKALDNANKDDRDRAEKASDDAQEEFEKAKERFYDAEDVRRSVESATNSFSTSSTAATSGSGQFSGVIQPRELSDKAIETVAEAVKDMVTEVLQKNYTTESCMALLSLSSDNENSELDRKFGRVQNMCADLISKGIYENLHPDSDYSPDSMSGALEKKINNLDTPESFSYLQQWLKDKNVSTTELIYGNNPKLRREALEDLENRETLKKKIEDQNLQQWLQNNKISKTELVDGNNPKLRREALEDLENRETLKKKIEDQNPQQWLQNNEISETDLLDGNNPELRKEKLEDLINREALKKKTEDQNLQQWLKDKNVSTTELLDGNNPKLRKKALEDLEN